MKLKQKVILFTSALMVLSGCSNQVAFFPYASNIVDHDTHEIEDFGHYYKPSALSKPYIDVLKSNDNPSTKVVPLPSLNEQKILVLPVAFPDYDLDALDGVGGAQAYVHLQNAFFGENRQTSWRSVSGFYDESSYGKLKISGEVAPWFTLPSEFSVSELRRRIRNSSDKINETAKIVNHALYAYQTAFPNKLSDFDQDQDGIVDAVYVIYGYPYESKEPNNVFWAFAAYMNRLDSRLERQANAYSWSSYHYLNLNVYQKPDAHTYIHEVGHLLGLTDYYNTNYDDPYAPLGGFDMMDYTVGDHTGLSKLFLNWTRPYVMRSSGEINLRPFSESGDLLLLKNNWNGRANDEYILLEYYTPTALNMQDSSLNATFKLPKANGIKLYHVDARTAYAIKEGSIDRYYYVNDYVGEYEGVEVLAHSNSSGSLNQAPMKDFELYKLVEPKESGNITTDLKLANVRSLFTKGDDFNKTHFQTFVFNDGTPFNYTIEIKRLTKAYATIKVEVL